MNSALFWAHSQAEILIKVIFNCKNSLMLQRKPGLSAKNCQLKNVELRELTTVESIHVH